MVSTSSGWSTSPLKRSSQRPPMAPRGRGVGVHNDMAKMPFVAEARRVLAKRRAVDRPDTIGHDASVGLLYVYRCGGDLGQLNMGIVPGNSRVHMHECCAST
eukprot:4677459-Lingulodinium_polyedra.AAC.1